MSSTFAVSTGTLAAQSGSIASISADIESSVASMMSSLVAMQDEWSGTASSSFQDLVTDWRGTQRQVKESLEEIGRALSDAGEAYDAAEAGVQAAFGRR